MSWVMALIYTVLGYLLRMIVENIKRFSDHKVIGYRKGVVGAVVSYELTTEELEGLWQAAQKQDVGGRLTEEELHVVWDFGQDTLGRPGNDINAEWLMNMVEEIRERRSNKVMNNIEWKEFLELVKEKTRADYVNVIQQPEFNAMMACLYREADRLLK